MHKSTESGGGQEFLNGEFRLLDRYELQGDLVQALGKTREHRHLVPKVAACHKAFRHWRCSEGHDWASAENSCSVRLCPHCARRRSVILASRVREYVGEAISGNPRFRYIVLAERNSHDLKTGIASLWAAWNSLRRSVRWKGKVKGAIVALEVTYNKHDKSWHPHLNVLTEGDYFPFEELRQAWLDATDGNGQTCHINAADEETVTELIKYVTKIADLLNAPAQIDEFLNVVSGRRLLRTYGSFRGLTLGDDDEPEERGCCPDCGPNKPVSVVQLGYVYPHQLTFDFTKGVFRPARAPVEVDDAFKRAQEFHPDFMPSSGYPRPRTKMEIAMAGLMNKLRAAVAYKNLG